MVPIKDTPMLKLAKLSLMPPTIMNQYSEFVTCPLPEFFFPFYSLLWMGVVMSINASSGRFSPQSNVALIDTNYLLNGVTDSR